MQITTSMSSSQEIGVCLGFTHHSLALLQRFYSLLSAHHTSKRHASGTLLVFVCLLFILVGVRNLFHVVGFDLL
jgi:hypothetical protein